MASVTIPGASGIPPLVFTVTGTSTTNLARAFQSQLLANPAALAINVLSNNTPQTTGGNVLNEIFSNSSTTSYTLANGDQHTVVDVGAPTTVVGSALGGDSVLGTGATTYDASGGGNSVTFIAGTNVYNGSSIHSALYDTVTGGAGYDTINTGVGFTTVFSGSGHTLITLNDSVAGSSGAPGGVAYLGDGHATVVANGQNDQVATGTNGQVIFGDSSATGTLSVTIGDNATSSGPAGDIIVGGVGTTNVFDSVGGNAIFGGTGLLNFIGVTPAESGTVPGVITDSIIGGTSSTLFLASGDNIGFFGDTASGAAASVVAGAGNETLNGSYADGNFTFFGSSSTTSSGVFDGSNTGNNTFITGAGTESLTGGSGTNLFDFANGGPDAHITIADFSAGNDSVNFFGNDVTSSTIGSSGGTPDLTVTLSDQTTITFLGITSLSGHVVSSPK